MRSNKWLALFAAVVLSSGCKPDAEALDLLDMTMTERASDVIDAEFDQWQLKANTVLDPGTLNINVYNTERFSIGGVTLPTIGLEDSFDGPRLVLMLYSDAVMDTLIARVNTGGGEFTTLDSPNAGTLAEQIAATGAIDQIIGVSVSYYGDTSFWDEVYARLIETLGKGWPVPAHDDAKFWKVDDRYILLFPEYDLFSIFAANQVSGGCLVVGGPGLVDLGGCDVDVFYSEFPQNVRISPLVTGN